ncbi:MAG: hypothetical protein JW991_05320 [Candidatus Pacebacteria bacterium]|nr:hypothetical protein [Candidatus Paceibacterota bacterium]
MKLKNRKKHPLSNLFRLWQKSYLWFFFIIFILLRLPSLFEPLSYGDEGIYLVLGQAARKGLVFYRDIHDNKPPLLYWLAAFSGNFFTYRLLYFFWSCFSFLVFHTLAKALFGKNKKAILISLLAFSIFASIPLFEGTIANAENFLILTSMIGFLLLISKKRSSLAHFLAGVSFSLSALFKIPAVLDLAAAGIIFFILADKNFKEILAFWRERKFWFLLLGFLTPVGLTFIYFFQKNASHLFLKAAFGQNIPYLSSWSQDQAQVASLPLGMVFRGLTLAGLILGLFFIRQRLSLVVKVSFVWSATSFFAALLSARPYPHYLFQAVPALCLSIGLLFTLPKITRPASIVLALIIFLIFNQFDYYYYPSLPYYKNFYQWIFGQKQRVDYLNFWGEDVSQLYQAAAYLKSRTDTKERIFIWGDKPTLYPLSERLPVGRYSAAYHIKDFDQNYRETLTALSVNPPRFWVVFSDEEQSLGKLTQLLRQKYSLIKTFDSIKIFRCNHL